MENYNSASSLSFSGDVVSSSFTWIKKSRRFLMEMDRHALSGDLYGGNTVCLNCLKCLTLNSSLCFVNFLMTIFNKTIIGLCQLFILVLIIIIYFVLPLFILFQNLFNYTLCLVHCRYPYCSPRSQSKLMSWSRSMIG